MPRRLPLLLALMLLLPAAAHAVPLRLDLGVDDWTAGPTAEFNITLAPSVRLARHIRIGGRFGALLTTSPTEGGIPIDLDLRLNFYRNRFYIEGLAGPWLYFSGDLVHAHAALGFGLLAGRVSFGLEAGYLQPNGVFGVRLGFVL
jgi:hypothetical protein